MSQDLHDPRGKVRLGLSDGIVGGAEFSPCGRYRPVLTRRLPGATIPGSVLWIGMNPSTADAAVDDPTVLKETKYTRRWGYGSYVKCNVMDYRATYPKDLLQPDVEPCSDRNLPAIVAAAKEASLVIVAYGALHKKLLPFGKAVEKALEDAGIAMHVLALTKSGLPRHPLYLLDSCDPVPYVPSDRSA